MKKIALLATLTLVIGIFASQALAYRGSGGCPRYGGTTQEGAGWTAEQQAEFKKFYEATQELRNKMFADRAEMNALMRSENPDPTRIRQLAESMAQTRDQLAAKADELGVEAGPGFGPGGCGGPGYGRGGRGGCAYGQGGGGYDCPGYGGGRGGGRGRW